ncbi:MAG: AAA family ATPase [Microbacteriaceae bacterium]|nr:AAA family ATPase [Microbacteriaceae bacterium]
MTTITGHAELTRLVRSAAKSSASDSSASDSPASDSSAADESASDSSAFGSAAFGSAAFGSAAFGKQASEGNGRLIIGITGSPGAGKTTIAERLVAELGHDAQLLSMDGFHLPQARLHELGRRERMGAPDTFDVVGFVATLRKLRGLRESRELRGDTGQREIAIPGFDRDREEPVPGALIITAATNIVVVEGNYLLLDDPSTGWNAVAALLDLSFFVRLADDIRLSRLIARHERFGKSPAEARAWAMGPDAANAELIDRTAARADHLLELD